MMHQDAAVSLSTRGISVADYVADFLAAQGVRHVFEVAGGMITNLIDSIHQRSQIKLVSMHHEQGAAFAVDGAARVSGVPGVAMATSGPGATNLLTGIGSCFFDSTPAVFLTGQVNVHEQRGDRAIRQLGFQETDIVAVAAPLTKAAWRVETAAEMPAVLERAFRTALSGRPGPVLVDIPFNLQRATIQAATPVRVTLDAPPAWDHTVPEQLLADIAGAQRPLILAGAGIRSAGASDVFRRVAEHLGIPVVNSLLAVDALPHGHPLRVGMIGSYGNRWANIAVSKADLLLVLGSRLDIRQTGADTAAFKGDRLIYHVDCEDGEINNRVQGCTPIVADLADFLGALDRYLHAAKADGLPEPGAAERLAWQHELTELHAAWPDTREQVDVPGINPNVLMHQLSARAGAASAYVVDVGQHQMWAAQSVEPGPQQRFLTSGGMGAMGFALPAAIGAALAAPDAPVVMIAGDGSFQLNIQELQTVTRNRLPIKLVVLDNRCHGMVRQFQETYFGERYQSTYWGYSAPDFAALAHAYGIDAATVAEPHEVEAGLDALWRDPTAPFLLRVMIDTFANAYPKLAFGRPISEMEPFAQPIAMEST
jgi:acetolactate synthase-1/2/3 large subunit